MQTLSAISEYLKSIRGTHSTGQATEHSYRAAFQHLMENFGRNGTHAINEPTQAEYGAPDFIVELHGVPVGHVECKDIGTNLNAAEVSEQLKRYRNALPNLILTDYLTFRWYVDGEQQSEITLGRFDSTERFMAAKNGKQKVAELLDGFYNAQTQIIAKPADLARRMASKTRLLRNAIERVLADDAGNAPALEGLLASYREVLIHDLTVADFANMQAQTAAYGLFAARCLHKGSAETFNRQSANFTDTTPFLRDMLGQIAGPNADRRIAWIIDDLALLLARTDMPAVLEGFGDTARRDDPIVHFYEDFLAAYDPKQREMRGVYYTPEPVVSYIVRSVDWVLRERFELSNGLADTATCVTANADGTSPPRVQILDPAAGTGTFLREVISHIRDDLTKRGLAGVWDAYVSDHLLPRLFGFELLMAAYTICHLKLAMEISDNSGLYTLGDDERLNVFLTNSLTEPSEGEHGLTLHTEMVREAREAGAVKRDYPVMVVIGNPPYSGHSANKGKWIHDLMRGRIEDDPHSYFHVDGEPLEERNTKWLNDDYVKFIRFAQWRINQTGEGVLAFVTNHSYLDNPTFKGMRKSLLNTFDEIWLLDMHGNAKRKERSPDGSNDQNVFDIQQGVAIGIFVKYRNEPPSHVCRDDNVVPLAAVQHADLWGERGDATSGKYAWLAENSVATTDWNEVVPQAPNYFFVPRDYTLLAEYEKGWKLTDISPVNSVGIVTAKDKIAVQWTKADMQKFVDEFVKLPVDAAREKWRLDSDSHDWKVATAQEDLQVHADAEQHIKPILYRPFDTRATYFTGKAGGFICRPRTKVMRHMLAATDTSPNLGLSVGRAGKVIGSEDWDIVIATNVPTDLNLFRRGGNCLFPLYLYPTDGDDALRLNIAERSPNLASGFINTIAEQSALEFTTDGNGNLISTFGPEDVYHYIYAVLHSPQYRRRYADFLRSDFPRIPVPASQALFAELTQIGERLVSLHLMTVTSKDKPTFPIGGSHKVEQVCYSEPSDNTPGQVWINSDQYFGGITPQTWQFTIGGYQPAKKWLADRKERTLSFSDIETYQRICAALVETSRRMAEIDDTIQNHGGWPIGTHRSG